MKDIVIPDHPGNALVFEKIMEDYIRLKDMRKSSGKMSQACVRRIKTFFGLLFCTSLFVLCLLSDSVIHVEPATFAALLISFMACIALSAVHVTPFDYIDIILELGAFCVFAAGWCGLIWSDPDGTIVTVTLLGIAFNTLLLHRLLLGPWQGILIMVLLSFYFLVFAFSSSMQSIDYAPLSHSMFILQSTAGALAILGLMFGIQHYARKMRRPWLDSPNFDTYMYLLFFLQILLTLISDIYLRYRKDVDGRVNGLQKLAAAVLPITALTFAIRLHRVESDIEDRIEHRNRMSQDLLTNKRGLVMATAAAVFEGLGAMLDMLSECFGWHSDVSFTGGVMMAFGFGLLATSFWIGRCTFGMLWPMIAQSFVCLGSAFDASSTLGFRHPDTRYAGGAIAGVGALILMVFNYIYMDSFANMSWRIRTWKHIFHPANSILLEGMFTLAGSILRVVDGKRLAASVCWVNATMIRALHTSFSWAVWSSTHANASADFDSASDVPRAANFQDEADESTDVLICGGSISGLMLACLLGRAGVKAIVVESRTEISNDARFMGINSVSRSLYHRALDADLESELHSRGTPDSIPAGLRFVTGLFQPDVECLASCVTEPISLYDGKMGAIHEIIESSSASCRYTKNFMLHIMQSHQEAMLLKQVMRFTSIQLRHGWQVVSFSELEHGVMTSLCEIGSGKKCAASSTYIVGADGPSSTVSKVMGARFDGLTSLSRPNALLLSSEAILKKTGEKLGHCWGTMIARPHVGVLVLAAADPARALYSVPFLYMYEPTLSRTREACVSEILGTSDFEVISEWHWYWNFFICTKFSLSRAFLVGDAAHSWPPFGGTGGNTAYGDVTNLGWKLMHACKGRGGSTLLKSYDLERRQHCLKVALWVLNQTRLVGRPEKLVKFLCGPLMSFKLVRMIFRNMFVRGNRGQHANQHGAQTGFLLGFKLQFSPIIHACKEALVDDPVSCYTPCLMPGALLIDYTLADGKTVYDHVHVEHYTLLAMHGLSFLDAIVHRIKDGFASRGMPISAVNLTELATPDSIKSLRSEAVWRLYRQQAMIIVRPDLYVAWKLPRSSPTLADQEIDVVVSTLTGLDIHGNDSWYEGRDDRIVSYLKYMHGVFAKHVQPLRASFPKALAVHEDEKAAVIKRLKAKDTTFTATTKWSHPSRRPKPNDVKEAFEV